MITPASINFVRNQRRLADSWELLDKRVFLGGVSALGVSVVVLLGAVGWWQWTLTQERDLLAQQTRQNTTITQSASDETQYLSFVTRLDALQSVMKNRNSKKEALDFLALLARPTVSFDGIVYDASKKQLAFRIQANSVFAVEEFLEQLRQPDVARYYQGINVSNIRGNEDGQYIMDLSVTLQGELSNGQ